MLLLQIGILEKNFTKNVAAKVQNFPAQFLARPKSKILIAISSIRKKFSFKFIEVLKIYYAFNKAH